MTEYKINNATVRIHGTVNQDVLKAATTKFLKQREIQKKKQSKENSK